SVVAVWRNVTETLTSLMARRALLDRLLAHERLPALGGRKDAHGLAVFGHRAPGDFDRVGGQHRGDMLVAERLAQIFAGDDAADLFLDAFAGDVLAVAAAQAALKKEFQLKQPLRRVHVFVRGRAAHGGLVHVDVFGHVAQHHRLESAHAALEKFLLKLENALGDAKQRLLALLDALDQPVRGAPSSLRKITYSSPTFSTNTSGSTVRTSSCSKPREGLGSRVAIRCAASAISSMPTPRSLASFS